MKYIKLFEDSNIDYKAIFDDNYLLIDLNDIGYYTRAQVTRSTDLFKWIKDDNKMSQKTFHDLSKTWMFNFEFDSLEVYIWGKNIKVDLCKEPILFSIEFLEQQGFIFEYFTLESINLSNVPAHYKNIEDVNKGRTTSCISLIFRLPNSKSRLIKSPISYPKFN